MPRGKRLGVSLGANSAMTWTTSAPDLRERRLGSSIKIGSETLKLSFLKHTVSR